MRTAVDWWVEELKSRSIDLNKWNGDLVEQAKEMEKKQIIDAFDKGGGYHYDTGINHAEQYYNKTFKNNKL